MSKRGKQEAIRCYGNIVGLHFKISLLKGFEHIAHYVMHLSDQGEILEQGVAIRLLGPAKLLRFVFLSDRDEQEEVPGPY